MTTGEMLAPQPIEAVNFHVWQPCNMHCRYCFAQFKDVRRSVLPEGHLREDEALQVVEALATAGFEKINFAGGEPTLCPWVMRLITTAKRRGMTTSLVTNGSRLTPGFLYEAAAVLDWLALSIDSVHPETLRVIGRASAGRVMERQRFEELCRIAVALGIRLKINTVVSQANWREWMAAFILTTKPERWKIMQVLRIAGQNDRAISAMQITTEQFESFVSRHEVVQRHGVLMVVERCQDMLGSYVLVDPAGRFIDNVDGAYRYSESILSIGVPAAAAQVRLFPDRFLSRGGRYDWRRSPPPARAASA